MIFRIILVFLAIYTPALGKIDRKYVNRANAKKLVGDFIITDKATGNLLQVVTINAINIKFGNNNFRLVFYDIFDPANNPVATTQVGQVVKDWMIIHAPDPDTNSVKIYTINLTFTRRGVVGNGVLSIADSQNTGITNAVSNIQFRRDK